MIYGSGGIGKSLIAAAAMSLMMGNAPMAAIRPDPAHKRVLVKVPSRADKKKAMRRADHKRHIDAKRWNRRGDKLARRLRRKFELGRAGAF